jgi:hypothetical protein
MKLAHAFVLALAFFSVLTAQAEVIDFADLHPPGDIPAWKQELKRRRWASPNPKFYVECREVSVLMGAEVCLFADRKQMSAALLRASASVEGLAQYEKGSIPNHNDKALERLSFMAAGHDLLGADLRDFYGRVNAACESSNRDPNVCLNAEETELFDRLILPRVERGEPLVVIGFDNSSSMSYLQSVSHELLHAQYFLDATFRETVDQFWNQTLTDRDRADVRAMLSHVYDASNEFLMRNEFQAYILMPGAEVNQLGSLVRRFREPLQKALAEKGVAPIRIE